MWVVAVGGWLAVVIAGSALTWVAIDRAGQQVTGSPGASSTQPAVVGTVGTAPTSGPSARQSPAATRSAEPTTSAAPTSAPAPTRTSSPGRSGSSAPKPAPVVRTETRTWTGAPGWVTVACTGSRATLKAASPNDGWSLERGDTYGDDIEVKFSSGGTEVQVKATCVGGVPRFGVESGASDDH